MNVLSLFDGISCGMVALERAGIKVDKYFSSEIDKYAMEVSQKNYPNIIQIWNAENVSASNLPKIDLLIGGSPCTTLSIAGDGTGFEGESGLFWEYARIKKEENPDFFLFENVKMKKEWMNVITNELGVEPHIINSSLLSAQHRERSYWTNIDFGKITGRDIFLSDILEDSVEEKYWLSQKEKNYMDRETRDGRNHWDFAHHSDTEKGKSAAVVANFLKGVPYNVLIDQRRTRCSFWSCDFQLQDEDFCSGCIGEDGNISSYQCENFPTPVVRKFTPVECERLQTLPDNYTQGVSNTQRYKMLGNAWTVDVVAHILSYLPSKYKTN